MGKRIITDAEVCAAAEAGRKTLVANPVECIITPRARDRADELGVTIVDCEGPECVNTTRESAGSPTQGKPVGDIVSQVMDAVRDRLPTGMDPEKITQIVAQSVAARMATGSASSDSIQAPTAVPGDAPEGVVVASGVQLLEDAAKAAPVAESAIIADGIGSPEGSAMSGTYMQWDATSFDRTVEAPEICVVIEGELALDVEGAKVSANAGDMLYLAPGTKLTCSSSGLVRVACVNLAPVEA